MRFQMACAALWLFTVSNGVFASDQIHNAICGNDVSRVKTLINRANVNQPLARVYPLELASYCYGGASAVANYLLDIGADVNLHKDGYTPLMWALRTYQWNRGFRPVVMRMLEKGADIRHVDKITGRTALMGAASSGDPELVRMLLAKGADRTQRTLGDWCISGQSVQCTAADQARLAGHVELALELEGKDSSAYARGLNAAIKANNLKLVQERIAAGADVNEKEQLSKLTPLHYAVQTNNPEIIRGVLAAGADPNVQNFAGISPLRDAITSRQPKVAFLLIDSGARANHEQLQGCGGGLTEYGWSIEYGMSEISRYIIEKGAIDPQNPGKVFAETYGKNSTDMEMAKLLIAKGARPSQSDIDALKLIRDHNPSLQKSVEPMIAFLTPYVTVGNPTAMGLIPVLRSGKSVESKDRNAGRDGKYFKSTDIVPGE